MKQKLRNTKSSNLWTYRVKSIDPWARTNENILAWSSMIKFQYVNVALLSLICCFHSSKVRLVHEAVYASIFNSWSVSNVTWCDALVLSNGWISTTNYHHQENLLQPQRLQLSSQNSQVYLQYNSIDSSLHVILPSARVSFHRRNDLSTPIGDILLSWSAATPGICPVLRHSVMFPITSTECFIIPGGADFS